VQPSFRLSQETRNWLSRAANLRPFNKGLVFSLQSASVKHKHLKLGPTNIAACLLSQVSKKLMLVTIRYRSAELLSTETNKCAAWIIVRS
jgi:hypothetical protein